jgi:acetyltransferase
LDFTLLFNPKTIAVLGVSLTNDRHPANVIYNKIHLRYPVKVYPVNPRGGQFQRDRVYADIADIPARIDLAVVAARAEFVPDILERCIGPNCLGIYAPTRFDTFFLPGERLVRPDPGPVAIVSQSGGVLVDQMVKFAEQGVGLSLAVSIGNKALIRELDMLEYLSGDPATRVIAFYVEGFDKNEGRRFVQAAASVPKPIIVLKSGKSTEGRRAASSHTASLAGDHKVFSSVLAQHGIVEADNEFEMVSFCEALSCYRQKVLGRVGIITVSGGHGVLVTDICAAKIPGKRYRRTCPPAFRGSLPSKTPST